MKKTILILTAAAAIAFAFESKAADTYSINGIPVQTVKTGTSKGSSGATWTNAIVGGSYTNVTEMAQGNALQEAIELRANIFATNQYPVQAIWQLARNISGGTATNPAAGNLSLELFAQVTNTIPVNSTVSDLKVLNIADIPATPPGVNVQTSFSKGAINHLYVYSLTLQTNSVTMTGAGSPIGTNCTAFSRINP